MFSDDVTAINRPNLQNSCIGGGLGTCDRRICRSGFLDSAFCATGCDSRLEPDCWRIALPGPVGCGPGRASSLALPPTKAKTTHRKALATCAAGARANLQGHCPLARALRVQAPAGNNSTPANAPLLYHQRKSLDKMPSLHKSFAVNKVRRQQFNFITFSRQI